MGQPTAPSIDLPLWAYDGGVYAEPPLSQRETGWIAIPGQNYGQIPPYQWANWLQYSVGEWLSYCNSTINYIYQQGIPPWNSATTYYTGSLVAVPVVTFTTTSANATAAATYLNNGQTFTVQSTISADNKLVCTYTGQPTASSGTLTKSSGTGDSTITYTAEAVSTGVWVSIVDSNLNNAVTNTGYWEPYTPSWGKAFQRLSMNSTATGAEYTYHTINDQVPLAAYTVPSGYNLMVGFLTISSGLTWTITGSMCASGPLIVSGTLLVNGTVHCN